MDETGTDHEHAHVLLAQLVAQALRERVEGRLGGPVDGVASAGPLGGHRGEHHELAPSLLAQPACRLDQQRAGAHDVDA